MKHWHILYNPKAGGDNGTQRARKLDTLLEGEKTYADITAIADMTAYLKKIPAEQSIVLCGGDGTLSRFVNQTEPADLPELYFYAIGSGNDFLHDLGYQEGQPPFPIRKYLQHLPVVETNGQKRRFVNGVGYGVDGEVCAEGARLREKNKGKINYTAIAVKCVLFGYKPMGATVTVDGVTKRYRKAWLAPAMKGRYFGGGMMIAPRSAKRRRAASTEYRSGARSGQVDADERIPHHLQGQARQVHQVGGHHPGQCGRDLL